MGLPGGSNGGTPIGSVAMAVGIAIAFVVMYCFFRFLFYASAML